MSERTQPPEATTSSLIACGPPDMAVDIYLDEYIRILPNAKCDPANISLAINPSLSKPVLSYNPRALPGGILL